MSYIVRKGIILNPLIGMGTAAMVAVFAVMSDWKIQYDSFNSEIPDIPVVRDYQLTMLIAYGILGLLISFIWYIIGKYLSPRTAKAFAKVFGGIKSVVFIEKDINSYNMGFWRFIFSFLNIGLAIFAVDLFLSSTLFANPNLFSLLMAIGIVTILEPIQLVNNDIGVRAYNETKSEIVAVSSVLDRLIFRLLQMGGLLGSLASITLSTDSNIINSIPGKVRIIFIRSFVTCVFIIFFYHFLFQPKANPKEWKKRKNITSGKTKVGIR